MPRLGWVVRPAEERRACGREKDGHRPAPVAGERNDGVHVHRVDVGALLAVDLDRNEVLVHQCRGRRVFEGLVLHDMAPVTGRVARRRAEWACLLFARARVPRHPRDTSQPGCSHAAGGTDSSRRRAGSSGYTQTVAPAKPARPPRRHRERCRSHGIAGVLQKVRTGFAGEVVHTGTVATCGSGASPRRRP